MTTSTITAPTAHTVSAADGDRLWIAGDTMIIKATAATTGGSLTLLEIEASPGAGPPPHVHDNEDEAFYVVDGTFEIVLGEEIVRAGAGDFAFAPRGTVHRFSNVGDAPARMLIAFTPGGLEGFFRVAGMPATGDGPPPPADAAEIARTEAAAHDYGLRIAV
jgi:quercetin dioxygenase-like cupin family protein